MEAYRNFCFQLAQARPSMAAVANACAEVLLQLEAQVAARADAFEPTAGVARWAASLVLGQAGVRRVAAAVSFSTGC